MSEDKDFDRPQRIAINRVYTRKGDSGTTSLVGGQKVAKESLRIASYGTVDELNAFVGAARQSLAESDLGADRAWLDQALHRVQHELFNLGSILATLPSDVHPKQPRVRDEDVARLEAEMDRCNADLEPLRSFVLPGGSRLNTDLHVCRTVSRRAERVLCALHADEPVDRAAMAYINRLSDAFFVWSRWAVKKADVDEVVWDPNA